MLRVILCFLIPAASSLRFQFGGAITPGEILLILLFPALFEDVQKLLRMPLVRKVMYALAIYLAAQVLSDIVRHTPPEDFLRGWARIGMMMFGFLAIGALVGTERRRILAFALGASMASLVAVLAEVPGTQQVDITSEYKFIVGGFISVSAFVLAGYGRKRFGKLVFLAPLAAGILAFAMNSRSLAGITLLAWVILWAVRYSSGEVRRLKGRTVLMSFGIVIAAFALFHVYTYMAPRGLLGDRAKQKFIEQTYLSHGKFSLTSGRSEIYFSWPKIAESPIIGRGSWPKDMFYVINKAQELGMSPEYSAVFATRFKGLIPSHSHFFGGWLEAGIIGALFWGGVLIGAVWVLLLDGCFYFGPLKPLLTFILVSTCWDVLFSPFGGERRLGDAFIMWIIVLTLHYLRQQKTMTIRERPQAEAFSTKRLNARPSS